MRYYVLILMIIWLTASGTFAQQPRQDIAVFFPASDYMGLWQKLPNTIPELDSIAADLRNRYSFQTETCANFNKTQIVNKLAELAKRAYGPQDQLLLFFSMHGYFDENGDAGCLVPAGALDADPTFNTWLLHTQLRVQVANIPCRHIMIVLDACYSGTFSGSKGIPQGPVWTPADDCHSKIEKALSHNSHVYITSGGKVKVPANSNFAERWRHALATNGGEDGILTYQEIWAVLTESAFPPKTGGFPGDDAGTFIFISRHICDDGPATDPESMEWQRTLKQNTIEGFEYFQQAFPGTKHQQDIRIHLALLREELLWNQTQKRNTPAAYRDYLDRYPFGNHKDEASRYLASPSIEEQMVLIHSGTFQMGCSDCQDDILKPHTVSLSDYYLSKFEVTVAQFKEFIDATSYLTDAEKSGRIIHWIDGGWKEVKNINWRYAPNFQLRPESEYDHPVVFVSWQDATQYCSWLSEKSEKTFHLPTEAQWEYAAGNGARHTKFSWGNRDPSGKKSGNFLDATARKYINNWPNDLFDVYNDGFTYTSPVGSFDPNDFGLYDMSGNVSEWCSDGFDPAYYHTSPLEDPPGNPSITLRVSRGGAWNSNSSFCRIYLRAGIYPDFCTINTGFRIAKAGPPEDARIQLKTDKKPTIDLMRLAMSDFKFDPASPFPQEQGRKLLLWIGVKPESINVYQTSDNCQVWGNLLTGQEVHIWTKTYEPDCYGVRFQRSDLTEFIGVNDTYFPLCKS